MQLLKKLVVNNLIVLGLTFGIMMSASADNNIELIKKQAAKGDAEAQLVLASSYYQGVNDLPQDYNKAFYWHNKSANQGNAISQYLLGGLYMNGEGVRQDYSKASYWSKKAADQNIAGAQFNLGIYYYFGKGVRQNKAQAKEWFGKSCDNGMQAGCDTYRQINEESD